MQPRVLIVGDFASAWGGTTAVCEGLAARLKSQGWRVLSTSHKQPRSQRLLDMICTTWCRHSDYDLAIVEVFSGPAFVWAETVCRLLTLLAKPYILWLHGGNLPEFAARWGQRVERLYVRSAAVVAQSGYLAEALPRCRELVRLIPNPLDLDLYPYRTRSAPRPNMIWLRSFHQVYNPSLAVHVVGLLAQDYPDIALTMVGPDKGDGSLEAAQELANTLDLQRAIRFQPGVPKEDVPRWLDSADILLNTTNVDNTPVSVQEAMACGLCVVSTNVGGIPHLAQDQFEALLVPPRDAGAMAEAVRHLLTTPGVPARLSEAARRKTEGMDWPFVVDKWERLLLSVPYATKGRTQ